LPLEDVQKLASGALAGLLLQILAYDLFRPRKSLSFLLLTCFRHLWQLSSPRCPRWPVPGVTRSPYCPADLTTCLSCVSEVVCITVRCFGKHEWRTQRLSSFTVNSQPNQPRRYNGTCMRILTTRRHSDPRYGTSTIGIFGT
jgi:hypothetical protein